GPSGRDADVRGKSLDARVAGARHVPLAGGVAGVLIFARDRIHRWPARARGHDVRLSRAAQGEGDESCRECRTHADLSPRSDPNTFRHNAPTSRGAKSPYDRTTDTRARKPTLPRFLSPTGWTGDRSVWPIRSTHRARARRERRAERHQARTEHEHHARLGQRPFGARIQE